MSAVRIIVCEKTGRWAAALRRALARGSKVVETRSLGQCAAELEQRGGLAAVEVTEANAAAAVAWFQRTSRRPHVRLAALAAPELAAAESLWREAGAVEVLTSVLEAPRLARLAARHRVPEQASDSALREWALRRLPWATRAAIQGFPSSETGLGPG